MVVKRLGPTSANDRAILTKRCQASTRVCIFRNDPHETVRLFAFGRDDRVMSVPELLRRARAICNRNGALDVPLKLDVNISDARLDFCSSFQFDGQIGGSSRSQGQDSRSDEEWE